VADGQGRGVVSRQKTEPHGHSAGPVSGGQALAPGKQIHTPSTGVQSERSGYRLDDVSDDRTEGDMGDILDAIIAEGSCRACGTPWASVVKIDRNRLVKVEGGCPMEQCVLSF
jgi:hypothetical protein